MTLSCQLTVKFREQWFRWRGTLFGMVDVVRVDGSAMNMLLISMPRGLLRHFYLQTVPRATTN